MSVATAVLVGESVDATPASDWDEYRVWTVGLVDDDNVDVGRTYTFRSRSRALDLAEKMAAERGGLEVILD